MARYREEYILIKEKDGSYMLPGRFIPVAERSGLIEQLGERVFDQVCGFIKTGELLSCGIRYLEVNLSVVQCENRELAGRYTEILVDEYQDTNEVQNAIFRAARCRVFGR